MAAQEVSIIELLLTQQGTLFDFATEWTKTNSYKPGAKQVTEPVYADFKRFAQVGLGNVIIRRNRSEVSAKFRGNEIGILNSALFNDR